jgi:hypothetical protein
MSQRAGTCPLPRSRKASNPPKATVLSKPRCSGHGASQWRRCRQGREYQALWCSSLAGGPFPPPRPASSPFGCRPSKIASTMSGASQVSGRSRQMYATVKPGLLGEVGDALLLFEVGDRLRAPALDPPRPSVRPHQCPDQRLVSTWSRRGHRLAFGRHDQLPAAPAPQTHRDAGGQGPDLGVQGLGHHSAAHQTYLESALELGMAHDPGAGRHGRWPRRARRAGSAQAPYRPQPIRTICRAPQPLVELIRRDDRRVEALRANLEDAPELRARLDRMLLLLGRGRGGRGDVSPDGCRSDAEWSRVGARARGAHHRGRGCRSFNARAESPAGGRRSGPGRPPSG